MGISPKELKAGTRIDIGDSHVHSSVIHKSQKVEASPVSSDE